MPWGSQSWLALTPETTYGVRDEAGTATWLRLHRDDAFTMRPAKLRQIIRSADGGNRRVQVVSARTAYVGQLTTLFYPSQAAALIGLATTLASNDLGSVTLDFFDSVRVQGYLGAKVNNLTITSSADQDYCTLAIGFTAQRLDTALTTLAQPAATVFPTDLPYEHVETAGHVSVAGSAVTLYRGLTLSIANVLTPTWDEQPYITSLYYAGRDVDFTLDAQYVSTTWRAAFEAQTALAASVAWVRSSPAKSVTFALKTKNYTGSVQDRIPLNGPAYQSIKVETFFDPAAATDCAATIV